MGTNSTALWDDAIDSSRELVELSKELKMTESQPSSVNASDNDALRYAKVFLNTLRNELITVIKSKLSTTKSINNEVLLPLESLIQKIRNNEIE